jgi:hypothetical protein
LRITGWHPSIRFATEEINMYADLVPDDPSDLDQEPNPLSEPDEPSDLDSGDFPCTGDLDGTFDETQWEAFVPDEDQSDPEPDPGDFWIENGLPAVESPSVRF